MDTAGGSCSGGCGGGGVTSFKPILEKPLTELTEDDISQLTREDCRKYLKEKGMRRPSWNKSQAIQQVISLKALLETSEDSGSGAIRKIFVSKPPTVASNSADSAKELSDTNTTTNNNASNVDEAVVTATAAAVMPFWQNDSPNSITTTPVQSQLDSELEHKVVSSPRCPGAANGYVGQMTIFYCGKVNVYDGVPPDKAQAIMHLAASPIQLPPDDSFRRPCFPFPYPLQTTSNKDVFIPSVATIPPTIQTERMTEYSQQCREKGNSTYDLDAEGQANRKISLQRYRDKKKDRFKGKKNLGLASSLDVYLNHQTQTQISNEQSTRSSTSSLSQTGVPQSSCNLAYDQPKVPGFSVDLNEALGAA